MDWVYLFRWWWWSWFRDWFEGLGGGFACMGWAGLAGMVGIGLNQPMGPGGGGRGKFGGPWCWSG